MNKFVEKNCRAAVMGAEVYKPALSIDELLRILPVREVTKLGSNENPFPTNPYVLEKISQAFTQIQRYADPYATNLRTALANYYSLESNQFIMGNGSAEVLAIIAHTFIEAGDEIIIPAFSFNLFSIFTQLHTGVGKVVPLENWFINPHSIINAVTAKTKIIYIANPNNPTGTWLTHQEVEWILQSIPPQVLLVLDEAYVEYNTREDKPCAIQLLKRYPNVILTRTFSKAFGLAGLRIGYGIADATIIAALNRVKLTFNVNILATAAALASLEDTDYLKKSIAHNQQEMRGMQATFDEWGLKYLPSAANFLTIDLGRPARPIYDALLSNGIIARTLENYQMPNYLSVTFGTTAENARFLTAFKGLYHVN